MANVVGVRFKPCGKIYDFASEGIETAEGDLVVVESDFGLNIARVVGKQSLDAPEDRELKHILRRATAEDLQQREDNKALEKEAKAFCMERIMARGLPMKLVATESTLDRKRIIFYFTSEGRIDFRELVKDLAAKFKTRIEMRQIGVRDEAKLVGGLGACGRELCCKTFLTSFEPVSIRMAKKQEMVLNVGKLSGLCSRLMCCLRYEYERKGDAAAEEDTAPDGEESERPEHEEKPRPPRERRSLPDRRVPLMQPQLPLGPAQDLPKQETPHFHESPGKEEQSPEGADSQTAEDKQRSRRHPRRRRRNKK